jgi:hypothetical protein
MRDARGVMSSAVAWRAGVCLPRNADAATLPSDIKGLGRPAKINYLFIRGLTPTGIIIPF